MYISLRIYIYLLFKGRINDVEVIAKHALTNLPDEGSIYYNMANSYGKAGKYAKSEKYYLRALELQPHNSNYYANIGKKGLIYMETDM